MMPEEKMITEMRRFAALANLTFVPDMRASHFVLSIFAPGEETDAFLGMQIGVAVLLDKPLIILAVGGAKVPPRLGMLADSVVEVDTMQCEKGRLRLRVAIERLLLKRGIARDGRCEVVTGRPV